MSPRFIVSAEASPGITDSANKTAIANIFLFIMFDPPCYRFRLASHIVLPILRRFFLAPKAEAPAYIYPFHVRPRFLMKIRSPATTYTIPVPEVQPPLLEEGTPLLVSSDSGLMSSEM